MRFDIFIHFKTNPLHLCNHNLFSNTLTKNLNLKLTFSFSFLVDKRTGQMHTLTDFTSYYSVGVDHLITFLTNLTAIPIKGKLPNRVCY